MNDLVVEKNIGIKTSSCWQYSLSPPLNVMDARSNHQHNESCFHPLTHNLMKPQIRSCWSSFMDFSQLTRYLQRLFSTPFFLLMNMKLRIHIQYLTDKWKHNSWFVASCIVYAYVCSWLCFILYPDLKIRFFKEGN